MGCPTSRSKLKRQRRTWVDLGAPRADDATAEDLEREGARCRAALEGQRKSEDARYVSCAAPLGSGNAAAVSTPKSSPPTTRPAGGAAGGARVVDLCEVVQHPLRTARSSLIPLPSSPANPFMCL